MNNYCSPINAFEDVTTMFIPFNDLCKKLISAEADRNTVEMDALAMYFVQYKKAYPLVQCWYFIEEFNRAALALNMCAKINGGN